MTARPRGSSHTDDAPDGALLELYVDDGAARRDREAAFRALVDRYERRVYAICYRYFGDHADAEEATQDTFLSLARRADSFRGDSKLSTWLYRVATNACHDLARKDARRPRTPVADIAAVGGEDADEAPSPAEVAAAGELAGRVREALLELDELSRSLVLLCAVEGQPYAEVAAAFDLPVGTVKSRVHRARAKLAELLADTRDDPPPRSGDAPADGAVTRRRGDPPRERGPPG